MACPYFEPQHPASPPTHPQARLPLIEEYEGLCQAAPQPFVPTASHRFQCCNQGNVQTSCTHFPNWGPTSFRYQITATHLDHLDVLMLEEKQHWPHAWHHYRFEIATGHIGPVPDSATAKAQLLAFCRSYLKRFPHLNETG